MEKLDLINQKFGRLKAIKKVETQGHNTRWLCECECGNFVIVRTDHLKNSRIKSCGCLKKELATNNIKHGMSKTRLYHIWASMIERCQNEKSPAYKYYGKRGVRVCKEWAEDFRTFKDWALNSGYTEKLTLDRIDTYGNYEPNNCKWSTYKDQANNKRNNHLIEFNGEIKTVSQMADKYGINASTLYSRLHRGWTLERALGDVI